MLTPRLIQAVEPVPPAPGRAPRPTLRRGMTADGIVGPKTWLELDRLP